MTIALPIPGSPDEISTFDGLVSAIQYTLKDTTLADHAARFIFLAEAEFNRVLYNPECEDQLTTTTAATVTIPPDFKSIRSIYLDTDPRTMLEYVTPQVLRQRWNVQTTGQPQVYSLIGNNIVFGPAPDDTYDLIVDYNRVLTALSSANQTNWLSEKHADLYLYAALVHAEFFGWNDERIPMIRQYVDNVIAQINDVGNRRRIGPSLRIRAGSSA
jgi:hypothetical protein